MQQLSFFSTPNPHNTTHTHTHTSISYKKVFCLFEQSGTFKNEYRKLGYEAYDYDIENRFGETDYELDLFKEIEQAYTGNKSIFDEITKDDLVLAFFPCIRFEQQILLWFRGECSSQKKWTLEQKLERDLKLHKELHKLYDVITKLVLVAVRKGFKLLIENPYNQQHYLLRHWCIKPSIYDEDRSRLGDIWVKPTMYWCINFKPNNNSIDVPIYNKELKFNAHNNKDMERSLIDSDYARNFILKHLI